MQSPSPRAAPETMMVLDVRSNSGRACWVMDREPFVEFSRCDGEVDSGRWMILGDIRSSGWSDSRVKAPCSVALEANWVSKRNDPDMLFLMELTG